MAAKNQNTTGYQATVTIDLIEVNQYGDHLGDGNVTFTKQIQAKGLSGLGQLLADIEKLGDKPAPAPAFS
jgi:hypothetical protein